MSNCRSDFSLISCKLGVQRHVSQKAAELNELLEARAGTTSLAALRLTGSCRLVICLDLAAKFFGHTLNKSDVVRLSSMNKKSYDSAVKVIASMLDLDEHTTLRELAVQFGCTGAIPLASDVLQRYISDQCSDVNYHDPMFLCAALIVASKNQKVRIDVAKLKERSGVTKSTLDKLIVQLGKYLNKTSNKNAQTLGRKRRGLMDAIEEQIQEEDEQRKKVRLEENEDDECDTPSEADYETWKNKILAKAAHTS